MLHTQTRAHWTNDKDMKPKLQIMHTQTTAHWTNDKDVKHKLQIMHGNKKF